MRRVVTDLGDILAELLEEELTGYLRLASTDALLLDGGATLLTVKNGVPVAAIHTESDHTGTDALADAAVASLYRIECYELDEEALEEIDAQKGARIPPALPAEQLVGDSNLALRTRQQAPDTRDGQNSQTPGLGAVASFLDDEEAISTIRDRARSEARERATEWGFPLSNDEPQSSSR